MNREIVLSFNPEDIIGSYFNEASFLVEGSHRILLVLDTHTTSKTALRKARCSKRFVMVDKTDLFLQMCGEAVHQPT